MKEQEEVASGSRHLIDIDGEHIYLAIFSNGKHEAAIPYENRSENERARRHMDAVMKRLSELHGYFETEDEEE